MSNAYFHFKQFTVWHDKCAMKVGTDGVLLGAWTRIRPDAGRENNPTTTGPRDPENGTPSLVLDVGTGTGLIALIIAQRYPQAYIDAIDIDGQACEQAAENVEKSPFRERIKVIHQSFTDYAPEKKYDLIVSNPPFFNRSLKSPDLKRNMARHNDSLPLKQLIGQALALLSENGRIALILPVQQSGELDFVIATHRLYAVRRTAIIPVEGASPKRFLIEMTTNLRPGQQPQDTLVLETKTRQRTGQYTALTQDFYL
jgi:tRNA1Val (adenine37-N6)-methyltransferase